MEACAPSPAAASTTLDAPDSPSPAPVSAAVPLGPSSDPETLESSPARLEPPELEVLEPEVSPDPPELPDTLPPELPLPAGEVSVLPFPPQAAPRVMAPTIKIALCAAPLMAGQSARRAAIAQSIRRAFVFEQAPDQRDPVS